MSKRAIFGLAALGVAGCMPTRGGAQYSYETRSMLESRTPTIQQCYDVALGLGARPNGRVKVHFDVEAETGKVAHVRVEPPATHALGECVSRSIEGLRLVPSDGNRGEATFTWDFVVGPPAPPKEPRPSG